MRSARLPFGSPWKGGVAADLVRQPDRGQTDRFARSREPMSTGGPASLAASLHTAPVASLASAGCGDARLSGAAPYPRRCGRPAQRRLNRTLVRIGMIEQSTRMPAGGRSALCRATTLPVPRTKTFSKSLRRVVRPEHADEIWRDALAAAGVQVSEPLEVEHLERVAGAIEQRGDTVGVVAGAFGIRIRSYRLLSQIALSRR